VASGRAGVDSLRADRRVNFGSAQHEQQVFAINGAVARYGQLHGPGTYYEGELRSHPRIHVDAAARATPALLDLPTGIETIVVTK
jgi:hypothetical protein